MRRRRPGTRTTRSFAPRRLRDLRRCFAPDVQDHDGLLDRIDAALASLHTQLTDGVSVLVDRSALLEAIPPDS